MDGLCGFICCTACVEKLQCMYVIVCMYAKRLDRMAWEVYIRVFLDTVPPSQSSIMGCAPFLPLAASRGVVVSYVVPGLSKTVTPAAWSWKKMTGSWKGGSCCMATPSQNNMIQDVFLYLDRSLSGPPFGSQLSRLSCTGDEDMGGKLAR